MNNMTIIFKAFFENLNEIGKRGIAKGLKDNEIELAQREFIKGYFKVILSRSGMPKEDRLKLVSELKELLLKEA